MSRELLSFVIPCYRSEKTIEAVVEELKKEISKRGDEYDYEIFLVNDHSPDNVWSVICSLCKSDEKIHGISFSRNFGQHSALMAGYAHCKGSIIITLDDDGQAPVESIYALVDKLHEGYDVVFGRYDEVKQNLFRRIGSRTNEFMCEWLLEKPEKVATNSFYGMKDFVLKDMIRYNNPYPYIGGLIFRVTRNVADVKVVQRERAQGSSGYSLFKLIALWMNGFTAFSVKPLRIASWIGIISSMIGFIMTIATVVRKLLNPAVQLGYSSLMAVMLFIGGLIMLMLGLIGEYIGRIYICLNNSPQYVVKECINIHDDK